MANCNSTSHKVSTHISSLFFFLFGGGMTLNKGRLVRCKRKALISSVSSGHDDTRLVLSLSTLYRKRKFKRPKRGEKGKSFLYILSHFKEEKGEKSVCACVCF